MYEAIKIDKQWEETLVVILVLYTFYINTMPGPLRCNCLEEKKKKTQLYKNYF